MTIADNVQKVYEQINDACVRSNRDSSDVTVVAVSKQKPAADIWAAMEAGLQHFGENRVEEAEIKIPEVMAAVEAQITWHMIGHIQSRKARKIPLLFQVVHSVDSLKLAQKLSELVKDDALQLNILLQINISGEETKGGFEASNWKNDSAVREQLWQDVEQAVKLPGLTIQGLMTMAPIVAHIEQTRPVFAGMAELRDTLMQAFAISLPQLSMGMTDDFTVAIEEGATLVRVGRAIFGER